MSMDILQQLPIWQKNHLEDCANKCLFKDKKVLEVGGYTPVEIANSLGVKSWYCVDPAFERTTKINDNFILFKEYIENFDKDADFDFIIATNSFEHIHHFDICLDAMYRLLKQSGKLSALLGPIWSCYKGHHVWFNTQDNRLVNFNNIKLDDWAHLLYSKSKIKKQLLLNYDEYISDNISNWIFENTFLNRMFYDDYKNSVDKSSFKILEFRDWHTSKYPKPAIQQKLELKYHCKNFSTVSIKMILEK